MPWRETGPMKERIRFVMEVEEGVYRFSESCERYGVSRKTGYKWWNRYLEEGLEGLQDQSRAPHRCPHKTPAGIEARVVEQRLKYPRWGPEKLRAKLQRSDPEEPWPAASTMGEILKRHDLVHKRQRGRKSQAIFSGSRVQTERPNEILTADFKGEFRTQDGKYCYPLTIQDHYSRFALCCQALESTCRAPVRDGFERVFETYGLPEAILTDNGVPFAGNGLRRLSRLSVWWIRLGIRPLLIQPGHPEQNARHERYHRTLKQETAFPPAADQSAQQRVFDAFRQTYNHERPHQHLLDHTPAELYRPSLRPYPSQLPPLEYPGHYELRRVNKAGQIKLRNQRIFLSEVLEKETLGCEPLQDGLWSIFLGEVLIARCNEQEGKIYG